MSIMEIRDLEIPELEVYIDKKEVQLLHYYEPEPGIFIAESPNVILRALEAGYEPLSLLIEKKPLDERRERFWTGVEKFRFIRLLWRFLRESPDISLRGECCVRCGAKPFLP